MFKDFDMIVHKFGRDLDSLHVYPVGDAHIGSPDWNKDKMLDWQHQVLNDPVARVVIVGDMVENNLKASRGNCFESLLSPMEQKRELKEFLEPISHLILGAVPGNHEYRSRMEADYCPLYDVMAKLDIEDLYRPNMAFLKMSVGEKNKDRQFTYTMVLAHGSAEKKTENFSYAIDGMDVFVVGHTHRPLNGFPEKIVIDSKNDQIRLERVTRVVVPSFQKLGGYVLKGMYAPQSHDVYPVIHLSGIDKHVGVSWL